MSASRADLEAAVHAYRREPDSVHLAVLNEAGLDGIAQALEVEATSHPGIHRDDATARINGWLRPPTPTAGGERSGHSDGFGLGAPSPTG